jgi:hypothetical protein
MSNTTRQRSDTSSPSFPSSENTQPHHIAPDTPSNVITTLPHEGVPIDIQMAHPIRSDAQDVNSKPTIKFKLFPKLAPGLGLRIWKLSIFPRVVSFVPGGGKAPATLSACRDSRTETRKLYQLYIHIPAPQYPYTLDSPYTPPEFGVFINYDVDIV